VSRRDFLESPWISTAFFGGVLLVAAAVKLVGALVLVLLFEKARVDVSDGFEVGAFLLAFAVGTGCTVAWARRLMRRSGSLKLKNLVTGTITASIYAGACYVFFERDSPEGPSWVVLGITFAGMCFAVTSALNEVFS
jgi:amino acid transporter